MTKYHLEIENVKGLGKLDVTFDFSAENIVVITGKNGIGKTTLVKAFKLISDPQVFERTSSTNSINTNSKILFQLSRYQSFSFSYNPKLKTLDTKQALPPKKAIISELPIPYGNRFRQFSLVARYDSEMRANIASSNYQEAQELREFLRKVYPDNEHFTNLKVTEIKRNQFYFILQPDDYYIREDHFSSGEFFLIQLYRLITSGSELIVVDELDISLDASAQVHLFSAIQPLLDRHNSKLIVISHSLAFMNTVHEGGLYYLEKKEGVISLAQRSFGYVKSDLYGFKGRDRYIVTEDETLVGFIKFVISFYKLFPFFQYEIIAVGGQPQVEAIIKKNDEHEIFGPSKDVIVILDKDISNSIKYNGKTKIHPSPVDDIEMFIWQNRAVLLPDVYLEEFKPAKKDKDTAKTFWKKVVNSSQKSYEELYELVIIKNKNETDLLAEAIKSHLCLR